MRKPGSPPTPRELEVHELYLVTGSYKATAHRLGISTSTVGQHLAALYRRLQVANAAQAERALRERRPHPVPVPEQERPEAAEAVRG